MFEILEVLVRQLQTPLGIVIPVEIEARIGWMVVFSMKGLELLESELDDVLRVAARIQSVGVVGKERLLGVFGEHIVRRRVGAFHFIEDHALVDEGPFRIVQFQVPPFLLKDEWGNAGIEDRIEVDIDEIVEVLDVLTGYRVAGLVGIGEGIEKGLEGALQEFDEGFFDRVFARTAEDRMLQDVSHPGGILGRRSKGNPENLVIVVIDERQEFRAGFHMPKELCLRLQLREYPESEAFQSLR